MNLETLRKTVKGWYGREFSTDPDLLYPDDLLNQMINDAHRRVAEYTGCYTRRGVYDLPLGADGVSTVSLACDVIRVDPEKVRAKISGTWVQLAFYHDEDEVAGDYGVGLLDESDNGTPQCFFFQLGYQFEAQRQIVFYPGSDTLVSSGVRTRETLYPALMSSNTHVPALPPAEHTRLIYPTLLRMAELEQSAGRVNPALLARLEMAAQKDMDELKMIMIEFQHGGSW